MLHVTRPSLSASRLDKELQYCSRVPDLPHNALSCASYNQGRGDLLGLTVCSGADGPKEGLVGRPLSGETLFRTFRGVLSCAKPQSSSSFCFIAVSSRWF